MALTCSKSQGKALNKKPPRSIQGCLKMTRSRKNIMKHFWLLNIHDKVIETGLLNSVKCNINKSIIKGL